mgnify:CR=1 FL=1
MADLEDPQEVDDSVHQGLARENAGDTTLDILHTQKPTPIDFEVKRNLMSTGGAAHASSDSKLNFGAGKEGFQSPDSSRPSDPPSKKAVQVIPSPTSPLDWPGTPTQPLKKMKGGLWSISRRPARCLMQKT